MQIVQVNDNNTILEIDKSLLKDVVEFLKTISKEKNTSFQYIDDMGDIILVENGQEYVIPAKEDIKSIINSNDSDFIDENKIKEMFDV